MATMKELILNNPELPVVCTMTNYDDYEWSKCFEDPEAEIGEYFKHKDFNEYFTDRDLFELKVAEEFADELSTDEDLEAKVRSFEPFWKRAIIVEL